MTTSEVDPQATHAVNILPIHRFALTDKFVADWKKQTPPWGPLGEVTYRRTYSRLKADGTQEEWWETVRRVVDGAYTYQRWHCATHGLPWRELKAQRSAQTMYRLIFEMKFLPPGRGLWMCGTEYVERVGSAALNNCAMVSTANIAQDFSDPFTFLMDFSMLGVGVGGDCEGAGKVKIKQPEMGPPEFVEDTREGWVALIRRVLDSFVGKNTWPHMIDYSKVRPAGEPIRGFGGVSAGPEPLARLVDHIKKTLMPIIGLPITSKEIVDLFCQIGVCVVAGNVRRSAIIMLGGSDDQIFTDLKNPETHRDELNQFRWASNNSIFAEVGQDYTAAALSTAKNGEPGYFWLRNARAYGRMDGDATWADRDAVGTNPSLTAGTMVITDHGIVPIETLEDDKFRVVDLDGELSNATCRKSGIGTATFTVTLKNGGRYNASAEHQWPVIVPDGYKKTTTADLTVGDVLPVTRHSTLPYGQRGSREEGFLAGWITGDGWITERGDTGRQQVGLIIGDGKYWVEPQLLETLSHVGSSARFARRRKNDGTKEFLELNTTNNALNEWLASYGIGPKKQGLATSLWSDASEVFRQGFIDGLISADGCVYVDKHGKVRLALGSSIRQLLDDFGTLLGFYGVCGTVTSRQVKATFPNGKDYGKLYTSNTWRVQGDNAAHFANTFTLSHPDKNAKLQMAKRDLSPFGTTHVTSVTASGLHDVWDISVHSTDHCFRLDRVVTGNCSEQTLCDHELCCLVETFPSRHEDYEEYERTLKFAYLYAKSITLVPTHNPTVNARVMRNRRIGCSQSGIFDTFAKHGKRAHLRWCDEGYAYLRNLDRIYSDWLCVPLSRKITSVKPSGTVSLLPGVSPGIHAPHSKWYYRTIRIAKNSPLVKALTKAGYRIEDAVTDSNTAVAYFPVFEENFDRAKDQVTMWEQLENAAALQQHWADNQVSVTVTFKPEEAGDIKRALELYETRLKGVSFLPLLDHGYQQAPYQTITEAEYLTAVKKLKPINFSTTEHELTDAYCDGDSCILPG